ncbi:MAG: methyltransferase domain-containing protein [Planctomycetes bacterium]|nr:methyltransferase domain-containing protein [Planctomycetota bacterium]
MKNLEKIGLSDVQGVYSGPEGDLWELIMGEQIHIGGFASSMDLAAKADIHPATTGVDLCCCNGAGMRFLLKFKNVDKMIGVDATENVVERGKNRMTELHLSDKSEFCLADATASGLAGGSADFVWGEDAWCYVVDKDKLIAEAARLVKPGGTIAFTDWLEGDTPMTEAEAQRFLTFMKFPNIQTLDGYQNLLCQNGCEIVIAENTGRYAPCIDLYLNMLNMQLTYDALKIINFDMDMLQMLAGEMQFIQQLAHAGKVIQGLLVARKS